MNETEWQTVALYVAVASVAILTIWQWHRSTRYKEFSLIDLVSDEGYLSSRKFMEFGTWVVSTIAVVVMTMRGTLTGEFFIGYMAVFVLGRLGGQGVHAYTSATIEKAEIAMGKKRSLLSTDEGVGSETVEEVEKRARQARTVRRES
jgi:hypothetical protein